MLKKYFLVTFLLVTFSITKTTNGEKKALNKDTMDNISAQSTHAILSQKCLDSIEEEEENKEDAQKVFKNRVACVVSNNQSKA